MPASDARLSGCAWLLEDPLRCNIHGTTVCSGQSAAAILPDGQTQAGSAAARYAAAKAPGGNAAAKVRRGRRGVTQRLPSPVPDLRMLR
jgi:hypothetical protein